ncbi:alkaline phosphatase [Glutamicibacter sp. PS]|uniref:alkaline phosphatase n=1 Tax=Glutamicibacter sp. PS TaxID=3075634 RepID=UPI00284A4C14|nr:alkaline phosphatase [Glutamicibacter sp. PS]MDR4534104.1 alkaline phosphatase [Glutamicibacter sp. PS]
MTVRIQKILPTTAALALGLGALSGCATTAGNTAAEPARLLDRPAAGELSEHGGARRLDGDTTDAVRQAVQDSGAKNVILLIGDGMGDSEITAARNVAKGAGGFFAGLDALPLTGQYTHYSLHKDGKPDYVTDSAASGSAWATGTKTYNGAISVDINGAKQPTLLELAKEKQLATGVVTTAEIQDATPAVQLAHVTERKCYGPEVTSAKCASNALENGGEGSITEQLLNTRADLVLGGGAETFAEKAKAGPYKGQTLRAQAESRGYTIVDDTQTLQRTTVANQESPVLGLFAPGNMEVRWTGEHATKNGIEKPAQKCTQNPARDEIKSPDLKTMTAKAIDLLKGNEQGFFLQVEGASIDKQDHAANPCGQIGETVDLDEAVQQALDFAKQDGQTLVVVTADHAHTSQIVAPDTESPALTSKLVTADGGEMAILYGTGEEDAAQGHTGTQLRIAAYGPGAANVVGLSDQTDLFFTIRDALSLSQR